jgi:hypothetical protein
VALLLGATGCPRSVPPAPNLDGGPGVDGDVRPPEPDTDGDGLCDGTEAGRGTDPLRPDTDGDLFDDRTEVDWGFNPLRTDSPARALLAVLDERAGAEASVSIRLTVRGQGQSYTGEFQESPSLDPEGLDARSFYVRSTAVGAVPMNNVFEVVPEEERFLGVVGTTDLVLQVDLAWDDGEPRGCRRLHPFRYVVKRDDGTTVFSRRYFVVIVPEDDDGTWCPPPGRCI